MSRGDDPADDRTVIRFEGARPASAPSPAARPPPPPGRSDPTVVLGGSPPSATARGEPEGTVLADAGAWLAAAGWADGEGPAAAPPPEGADKVPLDVLLARGGGSRPPHPNPVLLAAAPVLTLLGQLRCAAELPAEPLLDHFARAVRGAERELKAAGVPADAARIALYVLSETVDDALRHLPDSDPAAWRERGMAATFFGSRNAGAGFFEALNRALADPAPHADLLELMHACLALGFQGQYRGRPNAARDLERVRADAHAALRHARPETGDGLSRRGPEPLARSGTARKLPLWAVGGGAVAMLAGAFLFLRTTIAGEGEALADELLALSAPGPVVVERAGPAAAAPPEAPPAPEPAGSDVRLERLRAALAADIAAGGIAVAARGDSVVVEISSLLLFPPGKATPKPLFEPVADRIAAALNEEAGPIRVIGHTDDVKPRASSAFKSNHDLSVARAEAVKTLLAARMGDASRLAVEGKGEDEPVADNATAEGRARNRRVELVLPPERAP